MLVLSFINGINTKLNHSQSLEQGLYSILRRNLYRSVGLQRFKIVAPSSVFQVLRSRHVTESAATSCFQRTPAIQQSFASHVLQTKDVTCCGGACASMVDDSRTPG